MKHYFTTPIALFSLGLLVSNVVWAQAATDVNCDGCVHSGDIATNGVRRADIQNFSINTPKLNNFAVTSEKIKTGAVTESKIAASAVGVTQVDPAQVQLRVGGSCAVGSFITAVAEGGSVTCGTGTDPLGFNNTRYGTDALNSITSGVSNTATGYRALYSTSSGGQNTATGMDALRFTATGRSNTATGYQALNQNTVGDANTAIGQQALYLITQGYNNIALGSLAGSTLTTGNYNIYIGHVGAASEEYTTRMGTLQTRAFIAGIRNRTTGVGDAVSVLIDSAGQLGTASSSRRYKEDIQDMGAVSERLLDLRPVTFRYKEAYANGEKPLDYGLIAEEVAEVFPELVVYNEDNQPETVKYRLLSSLLLNEVQKQQVQLVALNAQASEVEELRAQVAEMSELKAQVAELNQLVQQMAKLALPASELVATNTWD